MNAQQLAEKLNGLEYPVDIDGSLIEQAKEAGLVIVYGASDDLMEFEGAIYDEFGCYEGGTVRLDADGILPDYDNIEDEDEMQRYFARKPQAREIEALWDQDGYSWTYRTDIPHATFEVMEDGEHYCRGIVFAISDLQTEAA